VNYKIVCSTAVAIGLKLVLLTSCFYVSTTKQAIAINVSILIAGVALGWLIAILATPYGVSEADRFLTYKQTISAFVGGYLISKIDGSLANILAWDNLQNPESGFRVVVFVAGFLLSMLLTYVYRTYAR
jgi:hypothetical protein